MINCNWFLFVCCLLGAGSMRFGVRRVWWVVSCAYSVGVQPFLVDVSFLKHLHRNIHLKEDKWVTCLLHATPTTPKLVSIHIYPFWHSNLRSISVSFCFLLLHFAILLFCLAFRLFVFSRFLPSQHLDTHAPNSISMLEMSREKHKRFLQKYPPTQEFKDSEFLINFFSFSPFRLLFRVVFVAAAAAVNDEGLSWVSCIR